MRRLLPARDSARSTSVTAALSDAVHVSDVFVPVVSISPPFGADTVTSGTAMSRNVDVTVFAASIRIVSGLFVPVRSPLHAENAHPALGTAVSWTFVPWV